MSTTQSIEGCELGTAELIDVEIRARIRGEDGQVREGTVPGRAYRAAGFACGVVNLGSTFAIVHVASGFVITSSADANLAYRIACELEGVDFEGIAIDYAMGTCARATQYARAIRAGLFLKLSEGLQQTLTCKGEITGP